MRFVRLAYQTPTEPSTFCVGEMWLFFVIPEFAQKGDWVGNFQGAMLSLIVVFPSVQGKGPRKWTPFIEVTSTTSARFSIPPLIYVGFYWWGCRILNIEGYFCDVLGIKLGFIFEPFKGFKSQRWTHANRFVEIWRENPQNKTYKTHTVIDGWDTWKLIELDCVTQFDMQMLRHWGFCSIWTTAHANTGAKHIGKVLQESHSNW